jgi:predicted nucleic acid-binding protein
MIVISDTSPLNYLILIGEEELLPKLFGRVIIPNAVFDELQAADAPPEVFRWANNIPEWLEIKQTDLTADTSLDILDPGEKEAILLAQELIADLLLVDDRQARQAALDRGINITGTVGILDRAAKAGLVDLKSAIEALQKTNFRIADDVVRKLIEENEVSKVEPDKNNEIE